MILTIDVGNTNIVFCGFDENDEPKFQSRIATDHLRMEDEYAILLADILRLYGIKAEDISGAALSSVVPPARTKHFMQIPPQL